MENYAVQERMSRDLPLELHGRHSGKLLGIKIPNTCTYKINMATPSVTYTFRRVRTILKSDY